MTIAKQRLTVIPEVSESVVAQWIFERFQPMELINYYGSDDWAVTDYLVELAVFDWAGLAEGWSVSANRAAEWVCTPDKVRTTVLELARQGIQADVQPLRIFPEVTR